MPAILAFTMWYDLGTYRFPPFEHTNSWTCYWAFPASALLALLADDVNWRAGCTALFSADSSGLFSNRRFWDPIFRPACYCCDGGLLHHSSACLADSAVAAGPAAVGQGHSVRDHPPALGWECRAPPKEGKNSQSTNKQSKWKAVTIIITSPSAASKKLRWGCQGLCSNLTHVYAPMRERKGTIQAKNWSYH